MTLYAAATALSRGSRICPEPNLLNSYLLSWNRPIYDPVRCFGSKPDSILATAFMKLESRPKASEARLISSTGVPAGVSLSEFKTIGAGFEASLEALSDASRVVGTGWAASWWPRSWWPNSTDFESTDFESADFES